VIRTKWSKHGIVKQVGQRLIAAELLHFSQVDYHVKSVKSLKVNNEDYILPTM
jgi:hypothetical protein